MEKFLAKHAGDVTGAAMSAVASIFAFSPAARPGGVRRRPEW